MINAFHLGNRPGAARVAELGGLHRFVGWSGPIATDSGGFQVLSIIRDDPRQGTVREKGVLFRNRETGKKTWLTPQSVINKQLRMGSDIVIALDECTRPQMPPEQQRAAVERTIRWMRTSRAAFEQSVDCSLAPSQRPILVGVAQGGVDPGLRRACAEELLAIGVDALGFGGWPVDEDGHLVEESFMILAEIAPAGMPIFALGVGRPDHLLRLTRLRREFVFDCTLPTRDARHHRIYVHTPDWRARAESGESFYEYLYIADSEYADDKRPLGHDCDCSVCTIYSRAFIHHLIKVKDPLYNRLATIHNLRFYARLIDWLGAGP